MREYDFREIMTTVASSPIAFGFAAAFARWYLGDRDGGIRGLVGYIAASLFVSWAVSLYLANENIPANRGLFYMLLAAFVARDILVVISAVAVQLRVDPIGLIVRLWTAFKGAQK